MSRKLRQHQQAGSGQHEALQTLPMTILYLLLSACRGFLIVVPTFLRRYCIAYAACIFAETEKGTGRHNENTGHVLFQNLYALS